MSLYNDLTESVIRTEYEYYKEYGKEANIIIAMDFPTYYELLECEEIRNNYDMRTSSDEFLGYPICISRNKEFGFKVAVNMDRG